MVTASVITLMPTMTMMVPDVSDDFPLNASASVASDFDNDGWPVGQDPDDTDPNNPGTLFIDSDGDGVGDQLDTDDDNDGVADP